MTGTQALVRLPMLQRARDLAAGLNTAGFISGYRGSPVGAFDQALARAKPFLDAHHVRFQPGVNEDLAATSIWGTQQVNLHPDAKYDGVFAMWYGKGPGVDRCGDVFKHANSAGTSKHGGVLVLAGDDHAAKSSTLAHQSEHVFKACCIPMLNASSVQEYLDLGLHGFAMSRFSGCWVAFKCVTDVIESGAVVDVDPQRVRIEMPGDFAMPQGGLNIRWPDGFLEQEARLLDYKVYAALAYCRANRLDRIVWDSPHAKLGIITTGKSFGDTVQALADLGIDARVAADAGIRLYKVAMSWPLEPQGARKFAEGLEEILVVEEKRQVIEYQIKEELYNWREGAPPPRVVGKFDDNGEWSIAAGQPAGNWLLPAHYELSPALIVKALAARFAKLGIDKLLGERYRERVAYLEFKEKALARPRVVTSRQPYFCSGCPHNTSTQVPEGSRALAGIGCHFMALWMDRNTATFTHMGGEGAPWIGQAPFTSCPHVFANIGDGTYFHSGLLAIRAAVAAGVNMTYKILYNDAVAMTGGQHHAGPLDPGIVSRQIAAEGVREIVAVVDEKEPLPAGLEWAPGVAVRPREELDAVQRELREKKGVSAIIYVQTCATEKRRRRKRDEFRSSQARRHQRARLRRLRRLQRRIELPLGRAARDRVRQEADDQPIRLQQGLFLPERILPELRDRRGRRAAKRQGGRRRRFGLPGAFPAAASGPRTPARDLGDRNRWNGGHHHRPDHGDGGAPRGQGRDGPRHERARAEVRAGDVPRAHRELPRRAALGARRPRGRRPGARLRSRRDDGDRGSLEDERQDHARSRQRHRVADRRVREEPGLAAPREPHGSRPRRCGGGQERGFPPRGQARHRAHGRRDRHQHVHARIRVPEGGGAARRGFAAACDRAERCRRRLQQEGVPLGPAGGGRSSPRRAAGDAGRDRSD